MINSTYNSLKKQIAVSVSQNSISKNADLSYDLFSSKEAAKALGALGHYMDTKFQSSPVPVKGQLLDCFSIQYPHIISSVALSTINSDPNYSNFSASNQPFTMLTEALVINSLPIIFSESVSSCSLIMGRNIPSHLFPKYHTNQFNCDNRLIKRLPSGKVFESVNDTKRTTMSSMERKAYNFHTNNYNSNDHIYSNVYITSDVNSKYIPSPALNFLLKNRLIDTKDFFVKNKHLYTTSQYSAIEEAVNESSTAEKEFNNTGEIGAYNKILYNASKFITSDDLCKLLKIPNLF